MLVEVKVGALIMDPNSSNPIVVLKGVDSEVILPIWVGAYEANAIALEIEKIVPQRPMTHDLLRNLIAETGYQVQKVTVCNLIENTFYAEIELLDKKVQTVSLDARPSDAIALALRADCPIFVAQSVIDLSNTTSNQTLTETEFEDTFKSADEWPDLIG